MPGELLALALGGVLLVVHILLAGSYRTRQYGRDWNMGARDEPMPPLNPIAGRLARAQANFLETLPLAIIGLVGVVVTGKAGEPTALAGWIWLGARALYLPLYWAGIPRIRTLVWAVATLPLLLLLGVLLLG